MPGMGRSKYWWGKYHDARTSGRTKEEAAISASIAEKKHKGKRKTS